MQYYQGVKFTNLQWSVKWAKKCPACGSSKTKKKGFKSGVQRYLCRSCNRSFVSSRRPSRLRLALWKSFIWRRGTVKLLASQYGRSVHWIRKELRAYKMPTIVVTPCEIVAVIDCVFFGRTSGFLVVRDPHRRINVFWMKITSETIAEYQYARDTLEAQGFTLSAVVSDGRPGIRGVFHDLSIQMCHFHQKAIITRHLTRRPKLQAGKELKELVKHLCNSEEQAFAQALLQWHLKWQNFLKERTVEPVTGHWHYTHKRLRSAYRSLKNNLPYLFTYKRHPELDIPNTTNSLDGMFAHLKELLRIHRGLKPDLKYKIARAILQNRPTNL